MLKIDKMLNQIIKDIIKALSIFVSQVFSVVTFYQILFSTYLSNSSFKHIIVIFVILFTLVFLVKTLFLINEFFMRIDEIKDENKTNSDKNQEN